MLKIAVLDAKTLGADIDLSPLNQVGDVLCYDLTSEKEVIERIKDVDVVLLNKVQIKKEHLEATKRLKLIGLFATGYNNIDIVCAKAQGVAVTNVVGYSSKSVAQHTLAMTLHLLEKLNAYDDYIKTKAYKEEGAFTYIKFPFYELTHKVWGIIGMGAIGKEVAKLAEAFGCEVIYYSTSGQNTEAGYPCVSLTTLLERADIVSIHAPLNEQTQKLLSYEEMDKMKKEAILVNVGRGGIVDEHDLVQILKEEKIRGAALDVLEQEPITEDHPLYEVDTNKWCVTPHIAWASVEARRQLVFEVRKNIEAFYEGKERNRIV